MKPFLKSTMDWEFNGEEISNYPCEARIGRGAVVISYTHLGVRHLWQGTSSDGVNFNVRHDGQPKDTAALKLTEEFLLEGTWREDGKIGSWRIDLDDGV